MYFSVPIKDTSYEPSHLGGPRRFPRWPLGGDTWLIRAMWLCAGTSLGEVWRGRISLSWKERQTGERNLGSSVEGKRDGKQTESRTAGDKFLPDPSHLFKKKPGRAFFVFFCFFGALLDEERNTGRTLFFKGRCLTLWRLLDIESRAVVDVKSRGRTFGHTAGGMYPSRAAASQRLWRCPACALGIALLLQSVLELSASGESRKNSTPHHSNAQTKTPLISLSISIYLSLYSSMFLPFLGFFLALNWTM